MKYKIVLNGKEYEVVVANKTAEVIAVKEVSK